MLTTINEAGRPVLKAGKCLSLHSKSAGKVYILNNGGETLRAQQINAGDNIIDTSQLGCGSYAIRIENRNNYTLSSFEIQ